MSDDFAKANESAVAIAYGAIDEDRLARILDEYLAGMERGEATSPAEILARYPGEADALRPYLSGLGLFHAFAAGKSDETIACSASERIGPMPSTIGDFRIVREIGRGGMGVVYEAKQVSLRRRVALKVLPSWATHDAKQISRFKHEAQSAAHVEHPNIVPVYAIGEDAGVHYYAMQLIEGTSLADLLHEVHGGEKGSLATTTFKNAETPRANELRSLLAPGLTRSKSALVGPVVRPRTPAAVHEHVLRLARFGIQAAEALHAAHLQGIVHRDVKPSNLLIDNDSKLWVTDFGLARCRQNPSLTQTGDLVGTMRYMSPEQTMGRTALVDHRTDVYSLGVTLYEVASGAHPAGDASELARFFVRHDAEATPLRQRDRRIEPDFETIVMKALAELPEERYATAQALADDLRRFVDGEPIFARPTSVAFRVGKWAKKHRRAVFGGVLALCFAVTGLIVGMAMLTAEQARALSREQESRRNDREILNRLVSGVGEQLALIPGAEAVRQQLYADSLQYYLRLANLAASDPTAQADLAQAYSRIGGLKSKVDDKEEALSFHVEAQKIFDRLAKRKPENPGFAHSLNLAENNVGLLLLDLGRVDEAVHALQAAGQRQSNLRQARTASFELTADLASTYSNLGLAHRARGDKQTAADRFRQAIAMQEELLASGVHDESVERSLAAAYNNFASLQDSSHLPAAGEALRKAIAIQLRLTREQPLNQICQAELARTYNNLGFVYAQSDAWSDSIASYADAILLQENLIKASRYSASYRRDLAVSYNNRGMAQSHAGRYEAAKESFNSAIAQQQFLAQTNPIDARTLSDMGSVHNNLAALFEIQHRADDALRELRDAVACQKRSLAAAPENGAARALLDKHYWNYAKCLAKQGRLDEAASVALERKALWPNDANHLNGIARELVGYLGEAGEQKRNGAPGRERILAAAVDTLAEAVAAGLPKEKLQAREFRTLASRADFRLIQATP